MSVDRVTSKGTSNAGSLPRRGGLARYLNPFRLACYVLVLYAFAHTSGAIIQVPRFGLASDAVVAGMQSVHMTVLSADCTWYGFYLGFGWTVTIFMLFAAFVAWRAGGMSGVDRAVLLPLAWGLFVAECATTPLVFLYFFPPPMICQTAVVVLLGVGCALETRRAARPPAPAG